MKGWRHLRYFLGPVTGASLLLAMLAMVFYFLQLVSPQAIWFISYYLTLIILSSLLIWRAGEFFTPAAIFLGDHYRLPQSVKAAVIDATASSFPEFAVAIIAVLLLGQAEVGVGTIIGSALYNVLVIPGVVGLMATTAVVVGKEVFWRDALYYLAVVVLFMLLLWLFPLTWGIGVGVIFVAAYLLYLWLLKRHANQHRTQAATTQPLQPIVEELEPEVELVTITHARQGWIWVLAMMAVMGISAHWLVTASINLGDIIGVSPLIMAFVVVAAGTSVPDMVLSMLSARRGNYDAAISNVFGSNIFDICICLGIPILLGILFTGQATQVNMLDTRPVWVLFISTVVALWCFRSQNYTLSKSNAWLMLGLYVASIIFVLW